MRRNLSRAQFEAFCRKQPSTVMVLEACGSSHHWGRFLQGLGHAVRMIPPQYVKPFVKRGKNDRNGYAAEFGIITAKGAAQVAPLLKKIADTDVPQGAKAVLAQLGRCIEALDAQLADIDGNPFWTVTQWRGDGEAMGR